jgi:vacuolar-type H+-ATPase subunit I/STV1
MANDAFEKFKSSVNRGITTISVKTSSALEKTQIKTHIESLSKEVDRIFANIGENAYKIWESEERDYSQLNALCEQVKSKKAEIEELKEKLDSIDDRDNQILGTSAEETKVSPKYICTQCGAQYESPVNFCRKCGNAMK